MSLYDLRIRMEIVGSSSLMMNRVNVGLTEDIDVIRISRIIDETLLKKYDMNTRVVAMENYLPYNYQDRLIKLDMNTYIIDYFHLSLEDAIVAKIVAARAKDDFHLQTKSIAKNVDWKQLKICMEEMKLSL